MGRGRKMRGKVGLWDFEFGGGNGIKSDHDNAEE
jgi:hypothetical protein